MKLSDEIGIVVAVILVSASLLSGCASRTGEGALIGGALGGGTGLLLGGSTGAVAGGLLGAGAGALIGGATEGDHHHHGRGHH